MCLRRLNHIFTALTSNRQQSVEEGPVPAESDAEVFRRNVIGLVPFRFQLVTLGGKDFRQPFDRVGYEFVSLYHRSSRLVHETALNLLPTGAEVLSVVLRKQRQVRFLCGFGNRRRGTGRRAISGSQVGSRFSPRSSRVSISCFVIFVPPQVSL